MQSLQVKLILCFDGNETHVLPVHDFGNRLRIAVVVLAGLHERSHNQSGNQAYFMPLFAQGSSLKCDPTPASIPINEESKLALYSSSWVRENFLQLTA
jgi:hypothetical protein